MPDLLSAAPPAYPGNRLELLVGGEEAMEAMFEAARTARERLWLETFILMPDWVGRSFLYALEAAARRGVDVVLIVDHPVSLLFSLGMYRPLERAGGRVLLYNPIPPWGHEARRVGSLLNRDHRKILIADETAFCGGHNITRAYLGPGERSFFDVTLRVEGPAVEGIARVFAQTLEQVGSAAGPQPQPAARPDGVPVAVHMMDRKHGITEADFALRGLLRAARDRCYLAFGYFLPERWLVEELVAAAGRGVDVRVMAAGKTDLPMVRSAGRQFYEELLRAGVRVFELQEQKLHAKAVVADGEHFTVGSFDFNRLSAEFSLEVVLEARDPRVGRDLEDAFVGNMERSEEIHLAEWTQRGPVARATEKLMLGAADAVARARRRRRRPTVPPVAALSDGVAAGSESEAVSLRP